MSPLLAFFAASSLFASPARAADVAVQLGGLGHVQSVIAVVRDGTGVRVAPCNDAAAAPDTAADGIWSCSPVDISGDSADVVAIVDGRLVDGGVLSWDAGSKHTAVITSASGIVQISKDPSTLPPAASVSPSPGAPLVLGRLTGYGTGPSPVLVLGGGAAQLYCHDDGQFPDRLVNDGEPGCAGPVAAGLADLTLHSGDGKMIPVGKLTWRPGPIQFVTVDVKSATATSDAFDLPLPPLPLLQAAAPPPVAAVAPEPSADAATQAPPAVAPSASTGSPTPTQPPPPPSQPSDPVHATGVGVTLFGPWPWLVGALAGVGGVVGLRLRRERTFVVRPTLKPHPAPPLFPGGPSLSEGCVLRVDQPLACMVDLLATLATSRRVVVALPGLVELPPIGGAGVWVAMVPTWEEVAAGVVALARSEGAPVALFILGGATVTDPGAVTPDALEKLSRALPPGVWMGVVVGADEVVATWLPTWRLSGPPWTGARQ